MCLWIPALRTTLIFFIVLLALLSDLRPSHTFSVPASMCVALIAAFVFSLGGMVLFTRKDKKIEVITAKDKQLYIIAHALLEIPQYSKRIILRDMTSNKSMALMEYSYERNEEIFSYLEKLFGIQRESSESITKKDKNIRKKELSFGLSFMAFLVLVLIVAILISP